MRSTTAASPDADLSLVFGTVAPHEMDLIRQALGQADAELRQLAKELAHRSGLHFETTGVTLDEFEGGAWSPPGALLFGYVDGGDPRDSVAFVADLRRGEAPTTDPELWYVSGDVQVDPPASDPSQVMLAASELRERAFASPVDAATGLLEAVRELRALAATRPPTGPAWRAAAV